MKRNLYLLLLASLALNFGSLQSDVTISEYDERDSQTLKEIVEQSADFLWAGLDSVAEKTDTVLCEIDELQHDTRVIIDDRGAVLGFIVFYINRHGEGFIYLIAVQEKMRGKGYGSKLIRHAIDEFLRHGVTRIIVYVQTKNPARKLYEQIGFVFNEKILFDDCMYLGVLDKNRYAKYIKECCSKRSAQLNCIIHYLH